MSERAQIDEKPGLQAGTPDDSPCSLQAMDVRVLCSKEFERMEKAPNKALSRSGFWKILVFFDHNGTSVFAWTTREECGCATAGMEAALRFIEEKG